MVSVVFAANGSFTITGMNDMVTVFGQSLSGNFTVSDTGTGTVAVQISGLSLSLGGGLVMVTGGMANFTITKGTGGTPSITGTASGKSERRRQRNRRCIHRQCQRQHHRHHSHG